MTAQDFVVAGHVMPVHLTGFIGRERELGTLANLAGKERLLTLTGAGGSGKTRLARELAVRIAPAFWRVTWVDLSPVVDPEAIAQHIGAAFSVGQRADARPLQAVAEAIGEARVLLVLDNCEHLVEHCAAFVDALLRSCPHLTVLATSREALGVDTEAAWLVPPLASAEARELFVDRARTAAPGFSVSDTASAAIAEICRRLDGIPLAIELAAARVRVLAPEQIAARLDDAFRLLTSSSRSAVPRHRTLRATMDWSATLLDDREHALLRRLSVFAGGFGLEAAEQVCVGGCINCDEVLDCIATLVDKSWIVMESGEGMARYHLLEIVRQYARERLEEAGEIEQVERAHAEYFLSVIEHAAPYLVGGSSKCGLVDSLRLDQDNIRVATKWMLGDASRAPLGIRLASSMFWLWYAFGSLHDLRELADLALALPTSDPVERGRVLVTSALTATAQGDYHRAEAEFAEAMPLLEQGDSISYCTAVAKLGAAQMLQGDLDRAIVTLDRAIAITSAFPPHDIRSIFAYFWRSWAAYLQGEYDRARELMLHNLDAATGAALPTAIAHSKSVLARIELRRGEIESACRLAADGLEGESALGDGWGVALALDAVAIIAARRGRPDDAVMILAGTAAHRERVAMAIPGLAPGERDALIDELRPALGERFDGVWNAGRALPTDVLTTMAIAEAERHTSEHRVPVLVSAPVASARLRVRALGALQVSVGDRVIDSKTWGSTRPRELLVYLLLHPEGRTKEQIGLAFWPDASPAQLRNSFHVTLHRLRRALGSPDWVAISGERYRIDPSMVEEFDVASFERTLGEALLASKRDTIACIPLLEGAVAHVRGEFMDGESAGDWHLEYRERLQRRHIDALMTLGHAYAAQASHDSAEEAYRRVLMRDELHEEALRALMRAQIAAGARPQALREYQRFAQRLKSEFGASPARETERLVAEVLER